MTFAALIFTLLFAGAPACEYEDASELKPAAACKWDAGEAGNGIGSSFVALRGTTGETVFIYADGSIEI